MMSSGTDSLSIFPFRHPQRLSIHPQLVPSDRKMAAIASKFTASHSCVPSQKEVFALESFLCFFPQGENSFQKPTCKFPFRFLWPKLYPMAMPQVQESLIDEYLEPGIFSLQGGRQLYQRGKHNGNGSWFGNQHCQPRQQVTRLVCLQTEAVLCSMMSPLRFSQVLNGLFITKSIMSHTLKCTLRFCLPSSHMQFPQAGVLSPSTPAFRPLETAKHHVCFPL